MLYKDWDIELTGRRIRITPMRITDEVPYSHLLLGDLYDIMIETQGKVTTGIEDILNHTEDAETHAIRTADNDSFIGWICLQKDGEGRPDIGISLIEDYRNQGIGPEAISLYSYYLYSVYKIDRVYARISELNTQSIRAFTKLGAILDKKETDYRMKKIVDELPEEMRDNKYIHDILYFHIDLPIRKTTIDESQGRY